ncbi:MAG: DASS family sodium-coupled anion symporter [Longimicrobiales bacterium]
MVETILTASGPETSPPPEPTRPDRRRNLLKWAIVLGSGLLVLAAPVPDGIEQNAWHLLAIFIATMAGLIVQPLPGGAMVLLGIATTAILGVLPPLTALAGYSDPIVWLVLTAFMIARGMIKSGFGRRVALIFIRFIGSTSLGLGYALALTDGALASVIPSNSARAGGTIFPLAKSIAESYGSRPGPTANRLGAFLMPLLYQTDVIVCAIFLTGQASNPLIADFAQQTTGTEITYIRWLIGAIVPGLVSLAVVPWLMYRLYPPEIKRTPDAARFARTELEAMGPLSRSEILMLVTFVLVFGLWLTPGLHGISYTNVALMGLALLLVTGVLTWHDVTTEHTAWNVFVWYGGLIQLARLLGETGITNWFADATASFMTGWSWQLALVVLVLVYFYAHYAFASITAHVSAMYIPFLVVAIAAGAPPLLAALVLMYSSNLCASLTHYGTTPAPIFFGAEYISQGRWWRIGFVVSVAHILVWSIVGPLWWKTLGWW